MISLKEIEEFTRIPITFQNGNQTILSTEPLQNIP